MGGDSDDTPGKVKRRSSNIRKSRKEATAMPDENMQDPNENTATSSFESAKAHAKGAAEDLRAAAEAKAREIRDKATAKAQEFRQKAEHTYDEARARTRTLQKDGEAYVRENPVKAVLTALAAGFFIGLLLRR